jgi:hypothetical protein
MPSVMYSIFVLSPALSSKRTVHRSSVHASVRRFDDADGTEHVRALGLTSKERRLIFAHPNIQIFLILNLLTIHSCYINIVLQIWIISSRHHTGPDELPNLSAFFWCSS